MFYVLQLSKLLYMDNWWGLRGDYMFALQSYFGLSFHGTL